MASKSVASLNTKEYDELIAVLKEAREEKKVSQEKLSKLLGQSRNYVQRIEYKHRRIDVIEFIFLAKALGVEPHELFGRLVRRLPTPT